MEITQTFVALSHFGQTYDISLNWIGKIIEWLVSGIGIVGIGIIVFSLILKFVVLPFDIYQRISMRKQNNKMQENKERMEKLQKQYANDKQKYNQKVMEMYKENGVSMFSSCLPMILSMVVFFAAIGGFNAYSKYANIQNYNAFVQAYNEKIESYAVLEEELNENVISVNGGEYTIDMEEKTVCYTVPAPAEAPADMVQYVKDVLNYKVKDENGQIVKVTYKAKVEKTIEVYGDHPYFEGKETITDKDVELFYKSEAQSAVLEEYESHSYERVGFLWIKNVWNVDASYEHPLTAYDKLMTPVKSLFSSSSAFDVNGEEKSFDDVKAMNPSPYSDVSFEEITEKLTPAKEGPNGYFILILLSIGTILLQQVFTLKSQKAQNKYSSIDGQQASTQKTTMIIMTVMFGIFSFMYSSAFSLYMITSSVFSLVSTFLINKFVDNSMAKKEAQALHSKYNRALPTFIDSDEKKKK